MFALMHFAALIVPLFHSYCNPIQAQGLIEDCAGRSQRTKGNCC